MSLARSSQAVLQNLYIKCVIMPYSLPMSLPQTLSELAQFLGKDGLRGLDIQCFYCGCFLTWADRVLFNNAQIPIVWMDCRYYASCHSCVKANARLDFMTNFNGATTVDVLELQYEKSVEELEIRCLCCLRRLTRSEKVDVGISDPDLFVIRESIRTLCVVCRVGLQ